MAAQEDLAKMASNLEHLVDAELAALDDSSAWERVNNALYVDDDRDDSQIQADAKYWARFDFATRWGECFDGYAGVIFLRPENRICITIRDRLDAIRSFRVTPVGFRVACDGFERWCNSEAAT